MTQMKAYASFDDYLESQRSKNQVIIRALRQFVQRMEPGLSEAVKWGNGCWGYVSGAHAREECSLKHGFLLSEGNEIPKKVVIVRFVYVK